jgi:hypothetical protein
VCLRDGAPSELLLLHLSGDLVRSVDLPDGIDPAGLVFARD